jgi:hypothetical protein
MKKIIVYHGTAFDFENIDLSKSKNKRDFGVTRFALIQKKRLDILS